MSLKASPTGCEEASHLSHETYIPCNNPATRMVKNRDEGPYRMCASCAAHNTSNRGATDVGPFEATTAVAAPVAVHDYSDYEEGAKGSDVERHTWLNELSKLALGMPSLALDVARAEDALKRAQEALAAVAEKRIPELMDQLDLTVYPLRDGGKLMLKEAIRASIPKPSERRAFDWLRSNGQAGLIKRVVSLQFGKGQDEAAAKILEELRKRDLQPEDKSSVHPSTLKSFVTERLEAGKELPEDLFTVFRQRTATIDVK